MQVFRSTWHASVVQGLPSLQSRSLVQQPVTPPWVCVFRHTLATHSSTVQGSPSAQMSLSPVSQHFPSGFCFSVSSHAFFSQSQVAVKQTPDACAHWTAMGSTSTVSQSQQVGSSLALKHVPFLQVSTVQAFPSSHWASTAQLSQVCVSALHTLSAGHSKSCWQQPANGGGPNAHTCRPPPAGVQVGVLQV